MSWVQWVPSYLPINNIPIWAHWTKSEVTRMTTYKTEVIKGQSLTLASIDIEFMEAAKATLWQLMAWCPLAPGDQLLQSWLLYSAACGPWNQDSILKSTTMQPEILSITLFCRIQRNYHILPISSVLPNIIAHIYKCHIFFLLLLIKESCWTTFNYLSDNITIQTQSFSVLWSKGYIQTSNSDITVYMAWTKL